jgi:hypothetical protein
MKLPRKTRDSLLHGVRHVATIELYNKPGITSAELYQRGLVAGGELTERELIDAVRTLGGPDALAALVVAFGAKYRIGVAQVVAEIIDAVPDAESCTSRTGRDGAPWPRGVRAPLVDAVNIPGIADKLVDGYADDLRRSVSAPEAWATSLRNKGAEGGWHSGLAPQERRVPC